jgi:hypothetical protein
MRLVKVLTNHKLEPAFIVTLVVFVDCHFGYLFLDLTLTCHCFFVLFLSGTGISRGRVLFGCGGGLGLILLRSAVSRLFLSTISVGSFSPVSTLQRRFLLVTFDKHASNDSLWIRLVRLVPTRVSSLLSVGLFLHSHRLTFDKMAADWVLFFFVRLSLGSFSPLSLSAFSRPFPPFNAVFSWLLLTNMRQMTLLGSALSGSFQRASRRHYRSGYSYPLIV